MKRIIGLIILVATLSIPGFASKKKSVSAEFSTPMRVASTDLPKGSYTVTWTDAEPVVNVSFVKGGKVIATVPAKLVQTGSARVYSGDQVALATSQQGNATVLDEIRMPHAKLSFTDDAPTAP